MALFLEKYAPCSLSPESIKKKIEDGWYSKNQLTAKDEPSGARYTLSCILIRCEIKMSYHQTATEWKYNYMEGYNTVGEKNTQSWAYRPNLWL